MSCRSDTCVSKFLCVYREVFVGGEHTGGKALLELLGLVVVLKHESVEVLLAADLELDVVGLLVLLDACGCYQIVRVDIRDMG